ncbi:hypothetical protein LTR60_002791 [Cryomyces antarcticus]|nr:hypothetical protein LTR60_002791 [Cryomyces antarcticus]
MEKMGVTAPDTRQRKARKADRNHSRQTGSAPPKQPASQPSRRTRTATVSSPIIAELVRARARAQATPTPLLADLSGTLGSGALGGGAGGGSHAAAVTGRLMRMGKRVLVRCLAEDRASRLEEEREARPDVGVDVGFEVERVERSKGVGECEEWTRMLAGRRSGWVGCGVGGDGVGVGQAERSGAWEGGGGVVVAVEVEDPGEEETDGLTFRGRDGGSDE